VTFGGTRLPAPAPDRVRVLGDADLPEALAVCGRDPVGSVLATARLEEAVVQGVARSGGSAWGFPGQGPLEAVCWSGANLVPVVPDADPEAVGAFAAMARSNGRRCSSIVGPASVVLGLWRSLEDEWSPAREVRAEQPSMTIDGPPAVEPDPLVRYSTQDDFPALLPACVKMFVEEVGYSPITLSAAAYSDRVRTLIAERRSFVRTSPPAGPGEIVFKAELGAVSRAVAQVQGVWVAPARRGRGYSETGMAAVVTATRTDVAPVVSLYVNSYNLPALATYRRVGFEQVGTFATVLF
jgi:uncharacterized protein